MLFYCIYLGCLYFEKQKLQGAWSFDSEIVFTLQDKSLASILEVIEIA
ncbi:MAG: hypothetical protein E6Y30_06630 [Finegoldia magna]|nr:hypothetical protein [Finegoldia magna]